MKQKLNIKSIIIFIFLSIFTIFGLAILLFFPIKNEVDAARFSLITIIFIFIIMILMCVFNKSIKIALEELKNIFNKDTDF
jgi:hypothetical protein